MYALYLKGFFRRMLRSKGYFLINITGLSIALNASMLILVWILYEKSFDRANADASRIYRVYSHIKMRHYLRDEVLKQINRYGTTHKKYCFFYLAMIVV